MSRKNIKIHRLSIKSYQSIVAERKREKQNFGLYYRGVMLVVNCSVRCLANVLKSLLKIYLGNELKCSKSLYWYLANVLKSLVMTH